MLAPYRRSDVDDFQTVLCQLYTTYSELNYSVKLQTGHIAKKRIKIKANS